MPKTDNSLISHETQFDLMWSAELPELLITLTTYAEQDGFDLDGIPVINYHHHEDDFDEQLKLFVCELTKQLTDSYVKQRDRLIEESLIIISIDYDELTSPIGDPRYEL